MEINIIASGSKGNCYIVDDGKTKIMLDCGIPYTDILRKTGFNLAEEIEGVLVTHEHTDHIKAAKRLMEKSAVNIYMSAGTALASHLSSHRIKKVEPMKLFTVGTYTILPFDVKHDAEEPLGFLIGSRETKEKLVYFTDTYYLRYKFKGINYILGECNYSKQIAEQNVREGRLPEELLKRLYKSHMSIEHFIDFMRANDLSQCKKIYLLHLSDGNSDEKMFMDLVKAFAPDGCEVRCFGN